MREVIHKLIEAEDEARRLVQAARAEAETLESGAKKQTEELITRSREEARLEAQRLVETTVSQAERERQERRVQLEAEIQATVRMDGATREQAIEAVIRNVCGCSGPGGGGQP